MPTKQITITEALADIRTLKARVTKQNDFVMQNLAYPSQMVDPLQRQGGSVEVVRRTRQAIADMQERIVFLRVAISAANDRETLSIEGETRSISGWLAWKREVGPDVRRFLAAYRDGINQRRNAVVNEMHVINQKRRVAAAEGPALVEVAVHAALDEQELAHEIEHFEKVWGDLDGQLSLRNASIRIEVPA